MLVYVCEYRSVFDQGKALSFPLIKVLVDQGRTVDGMVTDRFYSIYGRSDGASLRTFFDSDLKSTYCFCAHMHEITKYFLY